VDVSLGCGIDKVVGLIRFSERKMTEHLQLSGIQTVCRDKR